MAYLKRIWDLSLFWHHFCIYCVKKYEPWVIPKPPVFFLSPVEQKGHKNSFSSSLTFSTIPNRCLITMMHTLFLLCYQKIYIAHILNSYHLAYYSWITFWYVWVTLHFTALPLVFLGRVRTVHSKNYELSFISCSVQIQLSFTNGNLGI